MILTVFHVRKVNSSWAFARSYRACDGWPDRHGGRSSNRTRVGPLAVTNGLRSCSTVKLRQEPTNASPPGCVMQECASPTAASKTSLRRQPGARSPLDPHAGARRMNQGKAADHPNQPGRHRQNLAGLCLLPSSCAPGSHRASCPQAPPV